MGSSISTLYDNIASLVVASLVLLIVWFMHSNTTTIMPEEEDNETKLRSEVNDMLQNMSTTDKDEDIVSVCANCGKEGSDVNNICNKCKQVKYCNAACKKKHRRKHKKECEEHVRLATEKHICFITKELRIAAALHDEELFKQTPSEDCPICFIRLPYLNSGYRYFSCCGKEICSGCIYAPIYDDQGNVIADKKCAFCRTPHPTSMEEAVERQKKRVEANDANAIVNTGNDYGNGTNGYPQDYSKALELYHRAVELGFTNVYCNIGYFYKTGKGVEIDTEKARHYYELAAMGGNILARHDLGLDEKKAGNIDRALKHFIIAARGGRKQAIDQVKRLYTKGDATKDDYARALQSYQTYLGEIKSRQRDKAAAAYDGYRYY